MTMLLTPAQKAQQKAHTDSLRASLKSKGTDPSSLSLRGLYEESQRVAQKPSALGTAGTGFAGLLAGGKKQENGRTPTTSTREGGIAARLAQKADQGGVGAGGFLGKIGSALKRGLPEGTGQGLNSLAQGIGGAVRTQGGGSVPGPRINVQATLPGGGSASPPGVQAPNMNPQPVPQQVPQQQPGVTPGMAPPGGGMASYSTPAPAPGTTPPGGGGMVQQGPAPGTTPQPMGGDGAAAPTDQQGLRGIIEGQLGGILQGDFNRGDMLEQRFGLLADEANRSRVQAEESAARRAAALGRIGSGQVSTTFGDIASEFDRNLQNSRAQLTIEAADKDIMDRLNAIGLADQFAGRIAQEQLQREGYQSQERVAEIGANARTQAAQIAARAQEAAANAQLEAQRMGLDAQKQMQASQLAFNREALKAENELKTAQLAEQNRMNSFGMDFQNRAFEYGMGRDAVNDYFRTIDTLGPVAGDPSMLAPGYQTAQNAYGSGVSNYGANAAQAGQQSSQALQNAILYGGLGQGGQFSGINPGTLAGINY